MVAILPEQCVKAAEPTISNMQAGEEAWVYDFNVKVDFDRAVYLQKDGPFTEARGSRSSKSAPR
jgi:hypothetical protein